MRDEETVRERLDQIRKSLEDATMNLSQGRIDTVDFSGVASAVGIIQTLEWILEDTDELSV